MTKGGGMAGELVVVFLLCVALAVYGIYKYTKAEMSDYATFVQRANDLSGRMKALEDKFSKLDEFQKKIEGFDAKLAEFDTEVTKAQDHLAKVREAQIELRDRLSKKQPIIRPQGPIQVEIYSKPPEYPARAKQQAPPPPTPEVKKQLKRVKKQIDGLSQ